jgi:hypothetical protein
LPIASWIIQNAGCASTGHPSLLHSTLYTSFRGNICSRAQRAETVAQRKLESKKEMKTNLVGEGSGGD